jgi:hypothetical protein
MLKAANGGTGGGGAEDRQGVIDLPAGHRAGEEDENECHANQPR